MLRLIWLILFEDVLSVIGKIDYFFYYFGEFVLELIIEIIIIGFLIK